MAVQGIGSVATILTVIVVTSRFGIAGQGYWAGYRSVLDALTTLAIYGFPQAYTFFINRKNVLPLSIIKFTLYYLLVTWPIMGVLIVLAIYFDYINVGGVLSTDLITLIVSGLFFVAYNLLRGVALAVSSAGIFNIVTIAPAILQLICVIVWPIDGIENLPWAVTIAFSVSFIICAKVVFNDMHKTRNILKEEKLNHGSLMAYGFWWFLITFLQVSMPFAFYQLLRIRGADLSEVGNLSIALLVVGAMLLPINMVGPLIFNELTKTPDESKRQLVFVQVGRWLIFSTIMAVILFIIFAQPIALYIIGEQYTYAASLSAAMIISIPFAYYTRLIANITASDGQPARYALFMAIRVAFTVTPCALIISNAHSMALFYSLGEIIAAGAALIYLKTTRHWPWRIVLMLKFDGGR